MNDINMGVPKITTLGLKTLGTIFTISIITTLIIIYFNYELGERR